MQILKNPWENALFDLVAAAETSIKISSPFVKERLCREIYAHKSEEASFELITSFKLVNALSGSLDLSALAFLLDQGGVVKSHPRLHAKIYIFDDQRAVVTSGNLTHGGLVSNFEYGILVDDLSIVQQISQDFSMISTAEATSQIRPEHLALAGDILSKMSEEHLTKTPNPIDESPELHMTIIQNANNALSNAQSGWNLAVFNCIEQINREVFSLAELYAYENALNTLYPNNNHVRAKIRQQVQIMRDLGLLEFLNDGYYRKLWC